MNSTPNLFMKNLLLARQKQKDGSEGFTLVELMIVIVIVGILSAVALPNFLNQTGKAKATEATTKISALLKEAYAEYQFDGVVADVTTAMDGSKTTASATGNFTYTYPAVTDTTIFNVLATGNASDTSLKDKLMYGCIDLTKGDPDVSTRLLAAGTARDVKCK
jgi:type IV pilus assembly protein PilA